MIKLINVAIHNYKCIEGGQRFDVEDGVTVLVGMNESGKTSALEAIAKCNYFTEDSRFAFSATHDYPRARLKRLTRGDESSDAVTLTYAIDDTTAERIESGLSIKLDGHSFAWTHRYDGKSLVRFGGMYTASWVDYLTSVFVERGVDVDAGLFADALSRSSFCAVVESLKDLDDATVAKLEEIAGTVPEKCDWDNPIQYAIWHQYLKNDLPVFMYYDEYYALPSEVSLDNVRNGGSSGEAEKTASALIELADIDLDVLVKSDSFEDFTAELEATGADVSDALFKYWRTNNNLQIKFAIDKREKSDSWGSHIVDHVLSIRVENTKHRVSLPLENRSKGFNWFFSFLVWFKKMQADSSREYILLLDEPGLNLHAMAQADLLAFIEDLSADYQVIYTTHSPFMIDSERLERVRTMVDSSNGRTVISDSLQEKDPDTLFPLQAALGYSIAQNLFINKKNLVVEGISDLVFLESVSAELEKRGRSHLPSAVTVVPAGGADKIATFVSLMRGSNLSVVCLLDTFTDKSSKARIESLVREKIIREKNVIYYDVVLDSDYADIEDLFAIRDYLSLYNDAFGLKITTEDITPDAPIMNQLKKLNGGKSFNHYLPARELARQGATFQYSEETLDCFDALFKMVARLF